MGIAAPLRHKTAIGRSDYSKPVRLALENGLLTEDDSFFDYGCGKGEDVKRLKRAGLECCGWDPVFFPQVQHRVADVVNLGYVVNVIEDRGERETALKEAWKLAGRLLMVSARLSHEQNEANLKAYGDGFLTTRNTFQKFYDQHELKDWIASTLEVLPVPAAPGVFFVFRDDSLRESFEASRFRHRVQVPRIQKADIFFEEHKDTLEPLIGFFLERGRLPGEDELANASEVKEVFGSLKRAFSVVRQVMPDEKWEEISAERKQDFLVYLALSKFGKRPRFSEMSVGMRLDTKAFFGKYTAACKSADELLFAAGDTRVVDGACTQSKCGKLTHDALYIHLSGIAEIPPVLRVYEGCARVYIGDVEGATLVKLHRDKPKVSYLAYPDFDKKPHPPLTGALVISLNTFDVHYYDYSGAENPAILHRKETFVPEGYPGRWKFARLTKSEERKGLFEEPRSIGRKKNWESLLASKGVRLRGHRLVRE